MVRHGRCLVHTARDGGVQALDIAAEGEGVVEGADHLGFGAGRGIGQGKYSPVRYPRFNKSPPSWLFLKDCIGGGGTAAGDAGVLAAGADGDEGAAGAWPPPDGVSAMATVLLLEFCCQLAVLSRAAPPLRHDAHRWRRNLSRSRAAAGLRNVAACAPRRDYLVAPRTAVAAGSGRHWPGLLRGR